jgi:uncharacterized BrkB/YihY/UPF0761 family membrane protein
VACCPTACCLGYFGLSGVTALVADPRMIEAAAGTWGEVPPREAFVAMGLGSTLGALIALGIGIGLLVWGIRTWRRAPSEQV